jgi:hypothetical protein
MKTLGLNLVSVFTATVLSILLITVCIAKPNPPFTLYKNPQNQGIVIYPTYDSKSELEEYLSKLDFKEIDRGNTVHRFGNNRDSLALMMPESVQKKHEIQKFILIQEIGPNQYMVGIFDPEWGLTLPSQIFALDDVIANIPKTLKIFNNEKDGLKA